MAIEPRLADVAEYALELHATRQRDWPAWSAVKREFLGLVGASAEREALRGCLAYETAYAHLLACWETGRPPR